MRLEDQVTADNNHSVEYFPDGRPIPPLLTEEEAIALLRLDTDGPGDPSRSLKHYRDKGLLHPTQIGKNLRYSKKELLRFIDEMTDKSAKKRNA